jgi:hypothetical protein
LLVTLSINLTAIYVRIMLTLRRHTIKVSDKGKDLIIRFFLDTEKLSFFTAWDGHFRGEIIPAKSWIGKVKIDSNEFEVISQRTGIFKTGASMIVIRGKLADAAGDRVLQIKFRPRWSAAITLLGITVFLISLVSLNFNDRWDWVFMLLTLSLFILSLVVDLNKADEKLMRYLEEITNQEILKI